MYRINLYLSLFNKFIALLVSVSLLSTAGVFNVEKNIKDKVDTLCKATSISNYYNTIANFSYNIINTIVESTNLFTTSNNTAKNNNKQDNKTNKNSSKDFVFIQSNNEKTSENLKIVNSFSSNAITIINSFKYYLVQKYVSYTCSFVLAIVLLSVCYFARGNIDTENIKFNNIVKETRLA